MILKRIIGFIAGILLLSLLASGIFTNFLNFLMWLFMVDYSSLNVSITGAIITRILTFAASYSLVGIIFNLIGLFYKKFMKVTYIFISNAVGFIVSYIVWTIEEHYITIICVCSCIIAFVLVYLITNYIASKKENASLGKNEK